MSFKISKSLISKLSTSTATTSTTTGTTNTSTSTASTNITYTSGTTYDLDYIVSTTKRDNPDSAIVAKLVVDDNSTKVLENILLLMLDEKGLTPVSSTTTIEQYAVANISNFQEMFLDYLTKYYSIYVDKYEKGVTAGSISLDTAIAQIDTAYDTYQYSLSLTAAKADVNPNLNNKPIIDLSDLSADNGTGTPDTSEYAKISTTTATMTRKSTTSTTANDDGTSTDTTTYSFSGTVTITPNASITGQTVYITSLSPVSINSTDITFSISGNVLSYSWGPVDSTL